jgi:DNA-binding NarL/FixJ family response regulator
MPQMLREVIDGAIGEAPDMHVVGSVGEREPVATSLDRTDADVLIIGVSDEGGSATLDALLYERPRVTLLTIGANGRSTALHELRPHSVSLGDVSPRGLVDAIRASVHGRGR